MEIRVIEVVHNFHVEHTNTFIKLIPCFPRGLKPGASAVARRIYFHNQRPRELTARRRTPNAALRVFWRPTRYLHTVRRQHRPERRDDAQKFPRQAKWFHWHLPYKLFLFMI